MIEKWDIKEFIGKQGFSDGIIYVYNYVGDFIRLFYFILYFGQEEYVLVILVRLYCKFLIE